MFIWLDYRVGVHEMTVGAAVISFISLGTFLPQVVILWVISHYSLSFFCLDWWYCKVATTVGARFLGAVQVAELLFMRFIHPFRNFGSCRLKSFLFPFHQSISSAHSGAFVFVCRTSSHQGFKFSATQPTCRVFWRCLAVDGSFRFVELQLQVGQEKKANDM